MRRHVNWRGLILGLLLCISGYASADTGFRPPSDRFAAFVENSGTARIAVLPTIVRDPYVSRFSDASQRRVVEFLAARGLGTGTPSDFQIHLGKPTGISQFEMFRSSLRAIAGQLEGYEEAVDYVMVIEVLFGPDRRGASEVFGIHFFILEPDGTNAFSFLLNSHHKLFSGAKLRTSDTTGKGKQKLALKATTVALKALREQVSAARECAARMAGTVTGTVRSGMVDDLQSGLPSGADGEVPIGFSTFSGPQSSANIATTAGHPVRPGEGEGNEVLKLDLDVSDWAGVVHLFADEEMARWRPYDWSAFGEMSFWLYGHNSGTSLFVDVLDNRDPCSKTDTAERYTFEFVDDFSGWKLLTIAFADMVRKDIGNGAPSDGLGLSRVHGWGFGALNTSGRTTYYIDDVRVWGDPPAGESVAGDPGEAGYSIPINELPMYGEAEKTEWQLQADERFISTVLPRFSNDRARAAFYFSSAGWNYYYAGNMALAIRRFNQAWLLNPDDGYALWGFAVISRERGDLPSAVRFYEMALAAGFENPKFREEYEEARGRLED